MKSTLALVAAFATLATATATAARAESTTQIEAANAVNKLTEIVSNRQNYDIKTFDYQPVGDVLLSDCASLTRGLQLFIRDGKEISPRSFSNETPFDLTALQVIDPRQSTFDNGQEKFDATESGFDFMRTAPGTPDSGTLVLGEVLLRVWEKPGMKTRVYLHCLADYATKPRH